MLGLCTKRSPSNVFNWKPFVWTNSMKHSFFNRIHILHAGKLGKSPGAKCWNRWCVRREGWPKKWVPTLIVRGEGSQTWHSDQPLSRFPFLYLYHIFWMVIRLFNRSIQLISHSLKVSPKTISDPSGKCSSEEATLAIPQRISCHWKVAERDIVFVLECWSQKCVILNGSKRPQLKAVWKSSKNGPFEKARKFVLELIFFSPRS